MRGAEFSAVDISGEIGGLVINGVDVGPLIQNELDRRYPDRVKMRPTDANGFRDGWNVVDQLWAATTERARGLRPEQLHESVDGEWSFIDTLRHLAFATESWLLRVSRATPRHGTRCLCRGARHRRPKASLTTMTHIPASTLLLQ